jgi:hypothetical protein
MSAPIDEPKIYRLFYMHQVPNYNQWKCVEVQVQIQYRHRLAFSRLYLRLSKFYVISLKP